MRRVRRIRAVTTAFTPGSAAAAEVSMFRIAAVGESALRTMRPWSMPGRSMSSVNTERPGQLGEAVEARLAPADDAEVRPGGPWGSVPAAPVAAWAAICRIACATAFLTLMCPVQRQITPASASLMARSSGSGLVFSRPMALMIRPGVQTPHCTAPSSRKACCSGCSWPSRSTPSMVVMDRPSHSTARVMQESIARPALVVDRAHAAAAAGAAALGARQAQAVADDLVERLGRAHGDLVAGRR